MIYSFLYFILAIFSFLSIEKNISPANKHIFALLLLLLTIIAGLRSPDVGMDYLAYQEIFYQFNGLFEGGLKQVLDRNYFFEPGFALIVSILKTFSDNEIILMLFISALTTGAISYPLRLITPYFMFSLLIFYSYYFFTTHMIALRFGITAGLALSVLILIATKRKIMALLGIFLASSIHSSALILFLPYIFSFLKFRKTYILIFISVSLFFGFFEVGGKIISILPSFIPRANDVDAYTNSTQYGASLGLFSFINLKLISLGLLVYFFWDKFKNNQRFVETLTSYLLFAILLRVGFHDLGFIIGRMAFLLAIVEIIILPSILFTIYRKVYVFIFTLLYSLVSFYFTLNAQINPEYSFFFN